MLRIAICDDTKECVSSLEKLINDYCISNEIEFLVDAFFDGMSFCDAVGDCCEKSRYDIIFMDMQMPQMSGVDVINRVSESIKDALIFVTTAFTSYISATLRLGIFQFFSKPIDKSEFELDFARAIERLQKRQEKFEICFNKTKFAFDYESILYVSKCGKKLELHFKKDTIKIDERLYNACGLEFELTSKGYVVYYYGTLASVQETLYSRGFCRCHNSIIVNLSYVYSINSKTTSLTNGEILPVSRTCQKEFSKSFSYYLARGEQWK